MELIAYAYDFASFVMQNLKTLKDIKLVVLFGSVSRGEETKESDVDLFIDVYDDKKAKHLEKNMKAIKEEFYESSKFRNYWRPLGIENEINVIVGVLDKWKLKDSMLGSSIVLYQKYAPKLEGGESKAILSWGSIKPSSKRVMLSKRIFGYKHYGKRYGGLLENYNGQKIGTNALLISIRDTDIFLKEFRRFRIPVKIRRIFEYKE